MALLLLIVPPSPWMLGVCFIAIFLAVFGAFRRATTAGERRATHEVARVRLGISDEHATTGRWAKAAWAKAAWAKPSGSKLGQRT